MLANEIPKLVRLEYGNPYCEMCRNTLAPGQLVAWWRTQQADGRVRLAVHCAACHHDRVRVFKLPQARTPGIRASHNGRRRR